MESGSYKEFDNKQKSTKFYAILLSVATICFCTLIGLGVWAILYSSEAAIPIERTSKFVEEVIIVEQTPKPEVAKVFIENRARLEPVNVNNAIFEEVKDAIKQDEQEFTNRANNDVQINGADSPFIKSLVKFSNKVFGQVFANLPENSPFRAFNVPSEEASEEVHSRKRRSIVADMSLNAIRYLTNLSFGRFMFNEVKSITEYAVEGRKLSGDLDTFILDGVWPFNAEDVTVEAKEAAEKIDTESEDSSNSIVVKPNNRPASAFDDGWTPMVNQVSLKFITEMLTTLLNLMREYLMKDHVMECLWFMFCKDMNHQAKYTDPMGYLARVNSVGLKVLVDQEGRERDTINSVWQALTAWQPLQCDAMFPRCDGSKALEIVNEVANASR